MLKYYLLVFERIKLVEAYVDICSIGHFNNCNIIKAIAPIVGGGGGGRPNMAQAGGKDASKIQDALAAGVEEVRSQLA